MPTGLLKGQLKQSHISKEIVARTLLRDWLQAQPKRIAGFVDSASSEDRVRTWKSLRKFSPVFSQRVWAHYTENLAGLAETVSYLRVSIDSARGVKLGTLRQMLLHHAWSPWN